MQATDDITLLREYATSHSEAAFETLVSRHLRFVYSAALRQMRDPHLAEEVTQAVFVILAEKAGRLGDDTIFSCWLFKTTRFVAMAQARAAARRRQYEEASQMQPESQPETPNPLWEQIAPMLDDALAQLGEKDRQAVLLRFFEDKNLAEVGSSLGTGEDAARMRINRALEKLHHYFSKRGITSTAAILVGVISANSVQAAPATLAKSITAVALAKGATASSSTLTLIKGALKIMAWTKTKTAIIASVAVMMSAGAVALLNTTNPPPPKTVNTPVQQPETNKLVLNNAYNRVIENDQNRAQLANLKSQIWPQERQLMEAKIKARQAVDETTNATTIDLKPYVNAALEEAPMCEKGNNANNLAELPKGVHVFGGVPFDVQGAIYLSGGWLKHYNKDFPTNANIHIDRRCAKIHILHGGGLISFKDVGINVGKLVLHYADGSKQDFDIIAGKNIWDWWAPLFSTGVNPLNLKTVPGTEPAWTGSNPLIKQWQPDESLVLYKTTFNNPQPNKVISNIDFVSTVTWTVPFMVGLTVE